MLAYVFFHRPGPGVEVAEYETALRRFHTSLTGEPPSGFIESTTYRLGDSYADWYLVEIAFEDISERDRAFDAIEKLLGEMGQIARPALFHGLLDLVE